MEILEEVLQIQEFVSSTNFSREKDDLREYESMVEFITNSSSELYATAILTNQQVLCTGKTPPRVLIVLFFWLGCKH